MCLARDLLELGNYDHFVFMVRKDIEKLKYDSYLNSLPLTALGDINCTVEFD